ncbi:MAG: band 7 protein [Planctomycetaceae bacterium]|nr:band 7 protein [Planctomycetaceae bacterium]MBP60832.1 band 7 protein [Planctomycetaceae bacterium]
MVTFFFAGLVLYLVLRVLLTSLYIIRPDQRGVRTTFGRADRLENKTLDRSEETPLSGNEGDRYQYPRVQVIRPGGPYFKWPWQAIHKISVATQAVDLVWDPTKHQSTIEAVTKDNLTTGVNGQIRFRVCENNLYAYLFGVESPLEHVMGFFIAVLRERIANFSDPNRPVPSTEDQGADLRNESGSDLTEGISINDLRKNLPTLNQYMEQQCASTRGRYGVELDAALITTIDPPSEVDHALSAINSTRNQVAADISTARADAEQQITMSVRAVEIARNNAQAEVAPLLELANTLTVIKTEGGPGSLATYLRNMRIPLLARAKRIVQTSATR